MLNYFRGSDLDYSDLSAPEKKQFEQELDYYQMAIRVPAPAPELPPLRWDENQLSRYASLYCNGTVIRRPATGRGWNCGAIANRCVDRFTIEVIAGEEVMVGLVRSILPSATNHVLGGNMFLSLKDGRLYPGSTPYLTKIETWKTIEVFYDRENNRVGFVINGDYKGTAFPSIKGDYYPALDLGGESVVALRG